MAANVDAHPRRWKGKQRATDAPTAGGSAGMVVPLQMLDDSMYQGIYTIPVLVGTSGQNFSLQVDTGSSDLWIASKSCSTSACGATGGNLYDPSKASSSGRTLSIQYAEGDVSGPVVWDSVLVGGYSVGQQALAAASTVDDEPLESAFTGILGLALPANSLIAELLPSSGSPTGAVFAANLLGLAETSGPAAPFLSLTLERPGSSRVPSALGIGQHPALVDDPSAIAYGSVVTGPNGKLFWMADVLAITVYVGGKAQPISLGEPVNGGEYPTAVLDSGTPVILAMSDIASGIYGALGISPSSDGQYYVPCTTPLNMTITLNDGPEIALHPLDLTYLYSADNAQMCLGLIQNAENVGSSEVYVADMILGVPFLRNTYTVMAYEPPNAHGAFGSNGTVLAASQEFQPYLGLLNLTDPTVALQEFNQVRVQHQPLDSSPSVPTSSSKKLSVGVEVLIGIVAFFLLVFTLFLVRFLVLRRRMRRQPSLFDVDPKDGVIVMPEIRYSPIDASASREYNTLRSDTTLRASTFGDLKRRKDVSSAYTDDTTLTPRDELGDGSEDFPFRVGADMHDHDAGPYAHSTVYSRTSTAFDPPSPRLSSPPGLDLPQSPLSGEFSHARMQSTDSVAVPLLAHTRSASQLQHPQAQRPHAAFALPRPLSRDRSRSRSPGYDPAEFGVREQDAGVAAFMGVGTAARGARIDMAPLGHGLRHASSGSVGSVVSMDREGAVRPSASRTPSGRRMESYSADEGQVPMLPRHSEDVADAI